MNLFLHVAASDAEVLTSVKKYFTGPVHADMLVLAATGRALFMKSLHMKRAAFILKRQERK